MPEEQPRSRAARAAAERALVRVVHHYGSTPEFVLIGGLVPELLCSGSAFEHSGTTDVDVQVNLEIAAGAVNAANLERALRNAEFEPDEERVWRWRNTEDGATATVKFELLADLETERSGSTIEFVGCEALGAANLRGTGYAVRDRQLHTLTTRWKGEQRSADLYVTGLAGFLMAKSAAARSRRKNKDWYDIAYVLVHNDLGGPQPAARRVLDFLRRGAGGRKHCAGRPARQLRRCRRPGGVGVRRRDEVQPRRSRPRPCRTPSRGRRGCPHLPRRAVPQLTRRTGATPPYDRPSSMRVVT